MTDRIPLDELNSDQYDALCAEVDRLTAELADYDRRVQTLEHVAAGNKRHVQLTVPDLERAEAAIDRVRAAADKLADGTEAGFRAALAIREALDEPAPGTAATQATQPREHCGHLSPETLLTTPRTECVLRPGHQGSHADEVGCRWWPITEEQP